MLNRKGDYVSPQISEMGAVEFTDGQPFSLGAPFNLKNDGEAAVVLEVNLWGMPRDKYISTRFETGWNPEIIASIKPTAAKGLLWGN
jgi:hypothetical protein